MKTYCQNGIINDIFYLMDKTGNFQIQELEVETSDKFVYPEYSIKYTLDGELCLLYDTLRDVFFEDKNKYYYELSTLPTWVQKAGQDSDCCISADTFNKWINNSDIPNIYKHLYLIDCQFLIGTIQNLLSAMEDAFIGYYKTISTSHILEEMHQELTDPNGTIFITSQKSTQVSSIIETYFTKAYSILDIVCKICYEIQFKQEDFNSYKKNKKCKCIVGR